MSVFIIAEAGVNHNGSLALAKKLVDCAQAAGADCIKFQTFVAEQIVSQAAAKAAYQKIRTDAAESQLAMLRKLQLSFPDFIELHDYCKLRNMQFLSTAFDLQSIEFLTTLGMKIWKIPSGEITNLPYLVKIAHTGQPVILSTGMSTLEEIAAAMAVLRDHGSGDITLLHCTTEYPAPFADVNLKAMATIKNKFNVPIGYSDHTTGIEIPVAAAALGAAVIEKHFTLDKNMEGPDHQASLEPDELARMVQAIRNVEAALGNGDKQPAPSEIKNIAVARKSIVAARRINQGDFFTEDNITAKRPGTGISPMQWYEVIGQKAVKDFEEDELIII